VFGEFDFDDELGVGFGSGYMVEFAVLLSVLSVCVGGLVGEDAFGAVGDKDGVEEVLDDGFPLGEGVVVGSGSGVGVGGFAFFVADAVDPFVVVGVIGVYEADVAVHGMGLSEGFGFGLDGNHVGFSCFFR
jgi:hypothetical protein